MCVGFYVVFFNLSKPFTFSKLGWEITRIDAYKPELSVRSCIRAPLTVVLSQAHSSWLWCQSLTFLRKTFFAIPHKYSIPFPAISGCGTLKRRSRFCSSRCAAKSGRLARTWRISNFQHTFERCLLTAQPQPDSYRYFSTFTLVTVPTRWLFHSCRSKMICCIPLACPAYRSSSLSTSWNCGGLASRSESRSTVHGEPSIFWMRCFNALHFFFEHFLTVPYELSKKSTVLGQEKWKY